METKFCRILKFGSGVPRLVRINDNVPLFIGLTRFHRTLFKRIAQYFI